MIRARLTPLSKSEMEKLNTKRLLAYKKKRLMPMINHEGEYLDDEYMDALDACKEILATREHIEKKS